ncbi:uncharacterized protein F5147DRAFT_839468 [Suillus discolor]|uniref:F-box domain-containing protein n=1 Tax=Suillus discolor TaxID=1912936 RepID=A0A9P7JQ87_9AGAM|nr:uncharacterized protein F5147DRAFT_839468 [Suillus discolor]KAG2099291.1 hypothetical protein F5147DRAFT_839468 [Suillus discolor]
MNQVHDITIKFMDFPAELLLHILGHLDVYDLVRARKVCSNIRQLIDSSSELQYLIDVRYFNAIPPSLPGCDFAIATRRQLLQKSETAWQRAEYSQRNSTTMSYSPDNYRWSCGILGIPAKSLEQLKFIQPSLSDDDTHTIDLRQRICKIDNTAFEGYSFSPTQDLVVILSRAARGESHAYDVTFRSLSEDKPHPDAAFPLVKALDNQIHPQLFDSPYTQTMIFGDYYGLFCKYACKVDGELVDFLQIWNWKSKEASQCLQIFDVDRGTTNFSFLTNDRFLVASATELMLFSLETIDSVNAIRLVAKFSFPALRDPFIFHYITFSPIPFHASTHNQLIAINMCMSAPTTTKSPYFTFYIERNTLLELESTYISCYGEASQDSPNLPWSAWGSKHTRFFENSNSSCIHRIFGFRSADLIGDLVSRDGVLQSRSLRIRDFNPHRVTDFKAGNITTSHQRLVEGESPNSTLFLDPLGPGLPYIETISQEKFLANDMTVEANRITLLSLKGNSMYNVSQSIEILDFE